MLKTAGGIELLPLTAEVKEVNPQPLMPESSKDILGNPFQPDHESRKETIDLPISLHQHKQYKIKDDNLLEHQFDEMEDDNSSGPESLKEAEDSPSNLQRHKHLSERHRKELGELYRSRRNKQYEIHIEALQNARNTIILVAILIATITFTAGISPPGGVFQEGPLKGKSTVGRTTAFKIFTISNNIALFTSLCIVIVLVSIIPFRRKELMMLLKITHKVMWVAMAFLATAFVAATWMILPHDRGTGWVFETILAISAGTLGILFVYLGLMLAKHWLRKLKWRKERGKKPKSIAVSKVKNQPASTASVVEKNIQYQSPKPFINTEIQSPKHVIKRETQSERIVFNVENERDSDSESTNSDIHSCSSFGIGYHPF